MAQLLAHVERLRARLEEHRRGVVPQARELREALRLFTEMGATGHAERLAQELAVPTPS